MNPNDVPKKVMDSAIVGHNPSYFLIIMNTGNEHHGFALTPEGAKAFHKNLGTHLEDYEAKIRPIDASGLNPETLSPIQMES